MKYKVGVQVVCSISGGGPPPAAWKKKTTLQEVFGDFGQVLEIHSQEDGTAIVEFEDKRDALDAAQSVNGTKICGVKVHVEVRQEGRTGTGGRCAIDDRITEMAHRFQLDATSTARLVSAFRDRSRRGCNIELDIKQLSEHLAMSNKPSALVCMKLADLRDGKPVGACRYGGKDGDGKGDGKEEGTGKGTSTRGEPSKERSSRPQDADRDRGRSRSRRRGGIGEARGEAEPARRSRERDRERRGDRERGGSPRLGERRR